MFIVDAFIDPEKPFSGNPAAVCVLDDLEHLDDGKLQALAAEMNLSETAFVSPVMDKRADYYLRWFTPGCEVSLCGHATLATAAVLLATTKVGAECATLLFDTLSGVLRARGRSDGAITLDFPQGTCAVEQDRKCVEDLIEVARGGLPVADVQYSSSTCKLLLRLADGVSRSQLEQLRASPDALLKAHTGKVKGVIVTLKGQDRYDFFSRYFAPWVAIPEDPVCGSAHTVLATYWSRELGGKSEMLAYQCSPRGGELEVSLDGKGRVLLTGRAKILFKGEVFC